MLRARAIRCIRNRATFAAAVIARIMRGEVREEDARCFAPAQSSADAGRLGGVREEEARCFAPAQ